MEHGVSHPMRCEVKGHAEKAVVYVIGPEGPAKLEWRGGRAA